MIGNFSEAFAGIFGGLLATFSLRLPFYCQILIAFIGIPAALTLQEFNVKTKIVNPLANIWKIIRYSLFTNKSLCYDIMFSGIIGAATLTMAWFVQPVLMKIELPTALFGIVWTVLNLTVGIAALYSDKLNRKLGENRTYTLILILIAGGYLIRLIFATMAPFIGWLNDSISLAFALQITALIIFVPGLIFLILQWNKK